MFKALFSRIPSFLLVLSAALGIAGPGSAATLQVLHFKGTLAASARPGSDPFFQSLAGGSFRGTYSLPAGSLPGTSGTALPLADFRVSVLTAAGKTAVTFLAAQDSGGIFFDFFGPGTGDGFVFNGQGLQFQVSVATAFTGTGPITGDALFGVAGGPAGGIQIASGVAYVPAPASAGLLAGAVLLLASLHRRRSRAAA
jgi:hypothetical protein